MENLLESKERTLVMFDAVCSGLASCLNLVHSDIKQMTEHRNKLAQIEQQQIQAKLIPAPQLLDANLDDVDASKAKTCKRSHSSSKKCHRQSSITKQDNNDDDDDPHHLASLKLLDKRLADSFSHALSLNDLQKSSIAAKRQANQNRTSIFHVLLGKSNNKNSNGYDMKNKPQDNISSTCEQPLDNKMIIDDINKQTRLAMQYSKQLESHLFKVENLRSRYEMHLRMNSVVKNVSRAYLNDISALAEFESYMGSFLLAIEDIQGFARVCQGDVFKVSIKYGDNQKFKTKISVLKDRQKCDNRQSVFKARIADMLAIKAYECKSLGKRVLLGHKVCETRDLFTAQSQLMTISLNQTGSIKLNLIVTWNPLHFAPHSTTSVSDTASVSSSSMSSVYSVPSTYGTTTTINIRSQKRNRLSAPPTDSQHQQETLYQTVDPTYGYYLPPPDYHTSDLRHREA